MKFLQTLIAVLLAAGSLTAFAATGSGGGVTIQSRGQPQSGTAVVFELADRGKVSAGVTDVDGSVTSPLELANVGKIEMTVYVDECPNGTRKVVIAGPNGEQQTECKRRKIGVFWWTGHHVTIDVEKGTIVEDGGAAPVTAVSKSQLGYYAQLGAGIADSSEFKDACNQSSSSGVTCKNDSSSFAGAIDVGLAYHGWEAGLGYENHAKLSASETSGDSTSSSSVELRRTLDAVYVLFGYRFAVGEKFSVVPQVGAAHWKARQDAIFTTTFNVGGGQTSTETSSQSDSVSGTTAMFGIGLAWRATPRTSIELNWRHMNVSKSSQIDDKLNAFLLAVRYAFGGR